jgi:hypothetical protein
LDEYNSFRGIGIFNHGKLHNAPFICEDGDKEGNLYTKMLNGRPADGSYYSYFHKVGEKRYVDSKETMSDVSGW